MALAAKFNVFIGVAGGARPTHIDNFVTAYTGEAENTYSAAIDQSAVKTDINAAQVIVVDALDTTTDGQITSSKAAKDITVDDFDTAVDVLIAAAVSSMESYVESNSTGETINATATDLKAAIAGYINAILPDYATLKSDLATDIDIINPDWATHKTNLAAEVNSGVPSTANILKTTVLTAIKTEYTDHIATVRTYVDPRCKGSGKHALNQNPNTDVSDTTQVPCESCGQHGATVTQNIAIGQGWSLTEAY